MQRNSRNNLPLGTSMLFTDINQFKEVSLFDPYKDTIQQCFTQRQISTAQKSEFGMENDKIKNQQDQECKRCKYNFNDESEFGGIPCQMMPVSDEEQEIRQGQDSQSEAQQKQSETKKFRMHQKEVKRKRNLVDPETEQNYLMKKSKKKVGEKQSDKKFKSCSCRCKKTNCLKSYCQCFVSNAGCNSNCECQDCGNLAEPPVNKSLEDNMRQKKGQKSKKIESACQCKKTNCLKNYCQCYHSGRSCGDGCSCLGCLNQKQ